MTPGTWWELEVLRREVFGERKVKIDKEMVAAKDAEPRWVLTSGFTQP